MSKTSSSGHSDESDQDRIFRDPALDQATPSDDPLVQFVSKHWRFLLLLLAVYAAVWYGQIMYRQAQQRRANNASEAFALAHQSFERVMAAEDQVLAAEAKVASGQSKEQGKAVSEGTEKTKQGKEEEKNNAQDPIAALEKAKKNVADARVTLDEHLKIVADQGGHFQKIAAMYGAIARGKMGDVNGAVSGLSPLADWRTVKPESPDRLFSELAAYAQAKLRLASGETKVTGVQDLSSLAIDGKYVNAAAALALAASAVTEEEKAAARDTLEKVRTAHPEQIDLLVEEGRSTGFPNEPLTALE